MKKSLKKSEIIENLHRVMCLKVAIDFELFSIVQISQFYVRYIILIKYSNTYQVVQVSLNYGWIEYEIGGFYDASCLAAAKDEYFRVIANKS